MVYSITPFITERVLEQIKLDLCYNKNKVILLSAGGTCDYSDLGPTHHCPSDILVIDNYPNISWFLPFTSEQSVSLTEYSLSKSFSDSSYIRISNTPFSNLVDSLLDIPYFFPNEISSIDKQYTSFSINLGPDSIYLPFDGFVPDCHLLASSASDLSLIHDFLATLTTPFIVRLRCPFIPPLTVFTFFNSLKNNTRVCTSELSFSSSVFHDQVVNKDFYFSRSCQTFSF